MKKTFLITTIGLISIIFTTPAFAQAQISIPRPTRTPTPMRTPTPTQVNRDQIRLEREQENLRTRVDSLKQRAAADIDRRITSLRNLINRISTTSNLTDSQKSNLTNKVESQITRLNDLKSKILSSNDLATIETDIKLIAPITNNITRLISSVTGVLTEANRVLIVADDLNEVVIKLEKLIKEAQSRGENTADLKAALAEMKAKIIEARNQVNSTINIVLALQPENESANRQVILNARTTLRDARRNLQLARQTGERAERDHLSQIKRLENLKQRAVSDIDRRITSLRNLINRISTTSNLTDSQKSNLTNKVESQIARLNELKSKILNSNDLATIEADIKLIATIADNTNRLISPMVSLIAEANRILEAANILNELTDRLQIAINEARNRGQDTSDLETTLTNMQTKINGTSTTVNNTINTVLALQPIDNLDFIPALDAARETLRTERSNLQSARQDASTIVSDLKRLYNEFLNFSIRIL